VRGGRALQRMQGETGAARPARGVRVVEVLEGVKRHGSEKLDSKARPRVVCGEGVCGTGGARRTRRDVQGGLALQHGRGETGGVS